MRLGLRVLLSCYVRVRVEGRERLPDGPYLLCFNHPSWTDPLVLAGFWPDRRPLFIFGPRERNMSVGWRNRLITWSGRAVAFKPGGVDLLDTSRRAVGVLIGGGVLAVAGEGRLSDREDEPLPLQEGVAFFALRARAPVLPVAVIGTRWVHFGSRIVLRIGEAVPTEGERGRKGAARVATKVHAAIVELLADVQPRDPPGPFGRWLSELFNDRPWLTDRPVPSEAAASESAAPKA